MIFITVIAFKFSPIRIVFLVLDAACAILTIIGGITSAVYCGKETMIPGTTYCQYAPAKGNLPAAIVFSFITGLIMCVLTFFSFKNYKQ